jgi:hypothetical protein
VSPWDLAESDVETIIPSNDPLGRVLGVVDGALNGASTAFLTSLSADGLNATSSDVFVTRVGGRRHLSQTRALRVFK